MKNIFRAGLAAFFVSLVSCHPSSDTKENHSEAPFYHSTGGFDSQRLPLLAPYEAIRINRRDGWIVKLFSDSTAQMTVFNVQRMAVYRGTVYAAAKGTNYFHGNEVHAVWLLLTPPAGERVFLDSTAFYAHVPTGLIWRDLNQAYREFVRAH